MRERFSRCAERGLLSSCGARSSRRSGFSCFGEQALGCLGFRSCGAQALEAGAHRLSCFRACGIFPDQGWNLCLLHCRQIECHCTYYLTESSSASMSAESCLVEDTEPQRLSILPTAPSPLLCIWVLPDPFPTGHHSWECSLPLEQALVRSAWPLGVSDYLLLPA